MKRRAIIGKLAPWQICDVFVENESSIYAQPRSKCCGIPFSNSYQSEKVRACSTYNALDIEWAWANNQPWILQVRPITKTISSMQGNASQLGNVQGLAEGILWSPSSHTKPTKPYILYLPTIGPQHLPYLLEAEGVVVQQGGLLSHGAILCRELGKPLIIQPDHHVDAWLGRQVKLDGTSNLIDISGH